MTQNFTAGPDAVAQAFDTEPGNLEVANTPTQSLAAETAAPDNGFTRMGLAPSLLKAVADLGFQEPTAVQARAIPLALHAGEDGEREGGKAFHDLMVSSQTGSGKTAAYLLPVLHTLILQQEATAAQEKAEFERLSAEALARGEAPPKRPRRKNPLDPRHFKPAQPGALVLCPTRELAQQVAADAIDLVRHSFGLRIANVVGGIPYQVQIARLQNANLVVATPGRLLDLQRSGQIKLEGVQFLVIDEADRMLDLGFADDLAEIHQLTEQRSQTMMFSATFAPRIQQLGLRVMHNGGASTQRVAIDSPQQAHQNIEQRLYWADHAQHKRALLDHWLRDASINQAIVFASTQIECDALAEDLQQAGFDAVALHGALSQGLRNRRLGALRDGRVQILVATDVAARGIDVPTITHVFNFGLPMKAEDYTHRIGRTGRAGRDGLAITLAEPRDRRRIADIEAFTRQAFETATIPGLEPRMQPRPWVNERPRGNRAGHGGAGFGRKPIQQNFNEYSGRGPRQMPTDSYSKHSNFEGGSGRPHAQKPWTDSASGAGARGGRFAHGQGGQAFAAKGHAPNERFAPQRPVFEQEQPLGSGWGQKKGPRQATRASAPMDARPGARTGAPRGAFGAAGARPSKGGFAPAGKGAKVSRPKAVKSRQA